MHKVTLKKQASSLSLLLNQNFGEEIMRRMQNWLIVYFKHKKSSLSDLFIAAAKLDLFPLP